MTANTEELDLIGYAEAAEICGVKPGTMHFYHRLSKNKDYPENLMPRPFTVVDGKRPVWRRKDIEYWHNHVRPGPGNHTSGAARRGYTEGRGGHRKQESAGV